MSSKLPKKYQDLAENIAKSFPLGSRMDYYLIVRSKDAERIDQAASGLATKLGCTQTDARIAMKEYVAHLSKYDSELSKEMK